jgi:hypothetical protein
MDNQAAEPPAGLEEAIRHAAQEVLPRRASMFGEAAIGPQDGGSLEDAEISAPRALYNLGLDRIVDGSGLEVAELVGWRTLISIRSRPVAIVDAAPDSTVRSFNYGPFLDGLASATEATRDNERGRAGERVLQVPSVVLRRCLGLRS